MFSVRAVTIDNYLTKPIDEFRDNGEENLLKEWLEPVIRIFGATVDGKKTCVHVHGVYPYLYVPYGGGENPDRDALLLGAALDEALKTSFNSKAFRYVHRVILISGLPLYGYYSKNKKFFKIFFFNPYHIRKASELLLSGAILGQKFQPHESHIPFALQFMMDYNIYGMSFVTFSKVRFRKNPEKPDSISGVSEEEFFSDKVKKRTHCHLEVDVFARDIVNRIGSSTTGANPGLRAIWEDEKELRRRHNRPSSITVSLSQSRPEPQMFSTELMYREKLVQKLRLLSAQEAVVERGETSTHVYPAEVPDDEDILEASAVDGGLPRPADRKDLDDVSHLLDERILREMAGSLKESESEEEATEADSVLGRIRRSEEEAEREGEEEEEEEGVDMTQPLEQEEEREEEGIRDEPGRESGESDEDVFWRSMADKILQLDGAQESSSESDAEPTPSVSASEERTPDGPPGASPTWSTNIMSILSENSGCPTPSTVCQTPRTFWSNYSPNWLQEDCTWTRSGDPFPDLAANLPSPDPYLDLFDSDFSPSICNPSPAMTSTPIGDLAAVCPVKETSAPEERPHDRQKFLQVLKSFSGRKVSDDQCCHLTLKQYIKDCKEIVSVDFKELCNQEMIIIEYKSRNKSHQNKYLIKPLEKFLENWTSAERRANDGATKVARSGEMGEARNVRSVIVESKFGEGSRVQSVSNSLTVKSLEILPEDGGTNANVISQGHIKMKLIKRRGNLEKSPSEERPKKNRRTEKETKKQSRSKGKKERRTDWKTFSELDSKLINEINSSFEEYFESLVKRKRLLSKRGRKAEESDDGDDGDDDDDGDDGGGREEENDSSEDEKPAGRNADPIKLVTQFLSTFSKMSDVPPFSVTISLGNPPVQVNIHQPTQMRKEMKYYSKKRKRKTKIENVDGPADESSSDSAADERTEKKSGKKKKETYYKPLKVVVHGSPRAAGAAGKKRRGGVEERTGGEERRKVSSGDSFVVRRKEPKSTSLGSGEKKKKESESVVNVESVAKFSPDVIGHSSKKVFSESNAEPDFIDDSDEERKRRRRSRRWPRMISKSALKRIPQADTEGFTSSDEEGWRRILEKSASKKVKLSAMAEKTAKRSGVGKKETGAGSRKKKAEGIHEKEVCCATQKKKIDEAGASRSETKSTGARRREPHDTRGKETAQTEEQKSFTAQRMEDSGAYLGKVEAPGVPVLADPRFEILNENPENTENSEAILFSSPSLTSTAFKCPESFELDPPHPDSPTLLTLSGRPLFASSANSPESVPTPLFSETCARSDEPMRIRGATTIRPEKKPLTREEAIESMQHYDILESKDKAPFYSDPRDVTKALETGPRVLKIENRSLAGLKSFKNSLGAKGTEERRQMMLGERTAPRWQLVGEEDVTIEPLHRPPAPAAVLLSLTRKAEQDKPTRERLGKVKVKLTRPSSPGQEEESEEELELSVSASHLSEDVMTSEELTEKSTPEEGQESRRKVKSQKTKLETVTEGEEAKFRRSIEDQKGNSENSFQIRGVTPDNTFGFSHSVENLQNIKAGATHQYMDMLVVEVHVQTRGDLRPDPEFDPIGALFYSVALDGPAGGRRTGAIVVGDGLLSRCALPDVSVRYVPTEKDLFDLLLSLVKEWDPEILAGYEIEMHSWGYIVQRGFVLEMNLLSSLGRVLPDDHFPKKKADVAGDDRDDDDDVIPRSVRHMRVSGRIVLDIWRVLRHEVTLTSYTFENVMYHLAHERHPLLSQERLSFYWEHPTCVFRHIVVDHYVTRVEGVIRILDQLDFIGRTSELSRLFGIQFYEVLSRGSQFRVESMMLRLAKPLNYVPVSPSVAQRAGMRAPASLPLILEPESLFYADPVIVLDFQSLYPSMIIAYNYCFSTCLGRVEKLGGREPFEFGCTRLQISPEELKTLENDVSISPAGVVFVKANVRRGVLPAMLEEILETRLMVKKSMKENKGDKILHKVLFSRQLGLKLIANVTYGYTAANFSGRMPCIEVGDSVVSKGRETLHRAIQLVKNTQKWGARVVYGDTDSIFVLIPGRTREEAFKIGAEIAETVTRDNPRPVKLKLEKVYQPCILQTKKRYVGYKYESPEQEKPVFEAKGIETVRRDGCPATAKVLEKALRILFDTRNVSLVKKYTVRQFGKLFQGRVNMHDLIFAKEYRGRKGYRPGACVPALHLAKQWTQYDKRAEPRVKERVPYVIVNGAPGEPLIRLVRSPDDLLSNPCLRINAAYYITKAIIPAMQRCFSLLGADVMTWYASMPRKLQKDYKWRMSEERKRSTISQYFATRECVVCCGVTNGPLCPRCEAKPQTTVVCLGDKIRRWERCHEGILQICRSCCGRPTEIDCVSLDCPILFRRMQTKRALEQEPAMRQLLIRYL